ncbi:MAG TPA: tRNA pseudouridine(13) synthase TruD [Rhodanobacteraceae bacterium]|nr:tRNA pseudouridine(13) synthase TruD [Rhodanobacteraceae bacterium]
MNTMELAFAHGGAPLTARLRVSAEDFRVDEELGYGADGDGEHVFLTIEKRGLTTDEATQKIARFAGVKPVAIGIAGMKDRHAVTTQAVSVQLAGKVEPDWSALTSDSLRVVAHARHRRKLKRGALAGNRFELRLREVQGDRAQAECVLVAIAARGVPNHYGEQRFGRRGDNVEQALAMFRGARVERKLGAILLSAARSHLFNRVLDQRVRDSSWDRAIDGEVYCLAGSRSWFGPEAFDDALAARLASGDIHPSGPLWGRGELPSRSVSAALEQAQADAEPELVAGLLAAGLEQDRRPLRLIPRGFAWSWCDDDSLLLRFALPAGAYATTVVRELATTQ